MYFHEMLKFPYSKCQYYMCYDIHLSSYGFHWNFNKYIHGYICNKPQYLHMIETDMIHMWLFIWTHSRAQFDSKFSDPTKSRLYKN